jgi:hypothetical protein
VCVLETLSGAISIKPSGHYPSPTKHTGRRRSGGKRKGGERNRGGDMGGKKEEIKLRKERV